MPPPVIYITKGNERFGPFSAEQILPLVQNGHFSWGDLAWREGLEDWAPLHQVVEDLTMEDGLPERVILPLEEEEPEPSFFRELLLAFFYPFRGAHAWMILLFGTILVMMMAAVGYAFIFGLFASIFLTGYYIAFLFKIIQETAIGEQEVAEFPGFQDIWDDVLRPLAQVFFAIVACLLPAFLAARFLRDGPDELQVLPFVLVLAGLFYLPMVLLATVIFNSLLTALNPVLVVPAISRIFLRYLVIVLLLAATLIGHDLLAGALNERLQIFVAVPVVSFISFYMGIIQARILGLIYRTGKEQIGWFNR